MAGVAVTAAARPARLRGRVWWRALLSCGTRQKRVHASHHQFYDTTPGGLRRIVALARRVPNQPAGESIRPAPERCIYAPSTALGGPDGPRLTSGLSHPRLGPTGCAGKRVSAVFPCDCSTGGSRRSHAAGGPVSASPRSAIPRRSLGAVTFSLPNFPCKKQRNPWPSASS